MVDLPGLADSCWTAGSPAIGYPAFSGTEETDVLVVGAGIVGLTAALKLCQAGLSVMVLEALRVGHQVTGRSTAKITTQHGLIYGELVERSGAEKAKVYASANRSGMQQIKNWINEFGIACDFETKSAYAYISSSKRKHELEAEAETARKFGLPANVLDSAPLPFRTGSALCFPDQAQFNPTAYLEGIAAAVSNANGRVFEKSPARKIDSRRRWQATTDSGTVDCEHIIVATNLPVKSPVGFSGKTQPRSHVVMAFRIDDELQVDGMFISLDEPFHSIRTGRDPAGPLLIVLGGRFPTGHDGNVAKRFLELERWARENFTVGDVAWRWCNEDYDTEDRIPFVGEPSPDDAAGFYIATGFSGWGISNGTAAGILIADQILKRPNAWGSLYDPRRSASKNFNCGGESQSKIHDLGKLKRGEGGVVSQNGEEIAVWKDDKGKTHAVSAKCTHQGCVVTWNNADRTWDCPCHGSIFAADGSVIHGPARTPLQSRELA